MGSENDDEEVEDPNNQDSDEEYPEEDNYRNNWNIGNNTNEIDVEIDDEDDESVVNNRREEKKRR